MMRSSIWTDPDAIEGLATVGRVGFLVEIYRPGAGSVWELRNSPIVGRAGAEVLTGSGQARDNRHYFARGLAKVARHAKTSGRVCLAPVAATAELLEELGYPELAEELPEPGTLAQPIEHDDVRRPREVQLLLEQLAAAGLTLIPLSAQRHLPDGVGASNSALRRAVALAGSFHVALAELGGAS